ncbi:hypothetical protein [Streptomyces sp. G-G2]|uniref:hypothetical protein n=1 Tax=Streptomyces sp. G-G2 TaxID=3046201 RepID=UPI0024B93CCF|nr:hypothetical protein [Streptomyces sp. G-G2]MDJ0384417.1 hypothetical protein [Streptomyces sp. G-G2]
MTVDPAEPDTFQDQLGEEPGPEAPEADAAEQRAEVSPREDGPPTGVDLGGAADADAIEQARVVELDEDDYR